VRRHGATLGAYALAVAVLSVLGFGAADRLHFNSFEVAGTSSERAEEIARERFGASSPLMVLVEGSPAAATPAARQLAVRIERVADADVIGPWSPGAGAGLRPEKGALLLVVRVNMPFEETAREAVPAIRRTVEAASSSSPGITASMTGQADIYQGLHESSLESLHRAELIVAPVLLVILLLVFRSPIAALLPLALGVATIGAGNGFLRLLADPLNLDVVALNTVSMIGLALAVDYSLLMVSRFRECLRAGATTEEAVAETRRRAGRTVLYAGLILAAVMVFAYAQAAGDLLRSAAGAVFLATALSMGSALIALPAALGLIGPRIELWRVGGFAAGGGLWSALAGRVLARPGPAIVLATLPLLLFAVPALGISSGPPNARDLPPDRPERQDYEHLTAAIGSGWAFPYEVMVASNNGPVTEASTLRDIARWQADLAGVEGVRAVFGPAAIRSRTDALTSGPARLAELANGLEDGDALRREVDELLRGAGTLGDRLAAAADGAAGLTAGIEGSASGAGALADGASDIRASARRLAGALGPRGQLAAGNETAVAAARQVLDGIRLAETEVSDTLPKARRLAAGLRDGVGKFRTLRRYAVRAEDRLDDARDALEEMLPTSQADPAYDDALASVERAYQAVTGRDPDTNLPVRPPYFGLPASLDLAMERLAEGARVGERLHRRARQLRRGLGELGAGQAELAGGLEEVGPALERLSSGVDVLDGALARLEGGSASLTFALDEIATRSSPLAPGLDTVAMTLAGNDPALDAARAGAARLSAGAEELLGEDGSFGAANLRSGYLTLAAVDSAPERQRTPSTFSVNVDRGGSAARIYVIGDYEAGGDDSGTRAELERRADALAEATGDEVKIGGPGAVVADFDRVSGERIFTLVIGSTLIAYLILTRFLGSLLLPAVAVGLNLLTVATTFGVLVLFFEGESPLLGGPGFIDAISLSAITVVVFGLSIDYQVFLLGRMREEHGESGRWDDAITRGIATTAGVVTGAAAVMVAVFAAFALSDIANIRQLGFGLAFAIALDATIVRLVLLPAIVSKMGDRAWPTTERPSAPRSS
jgi:putative drug exporter of the RND superfamily